MYALTVFYGNSTQAERSGPAERPAAAPAVDLEAEEAAPLPPAPSPGGDAFGGGSGAFPFAALAACLHEVEPRSRLNNAQK